MSDGPRALYHHWLFRLTLLALLAYPTAVLGLARAWPAVGALSLSGLGLLALMWNADRARAELGRERAQLNSRRAEIDTIRSLARELSSSLKPERVFAILERECRKVFDFDGCLIALAGDRTHPAFAVWRHHRAKRTEIGPPPPALAELIERVLAERRGHRLDDLGALPEASWLRAGWGAPGTRSLLLAPLESQLGVTGVLVLESERVGAYDDAQLTALGAIARQAAQALESARHFERATLDSLTGLYVRDHFFSRLAEEDERARRYGGGFALLMIDLDSFKEINDRHGHLAGDAYLREIGAVIRSELRGADLACRYGGDEFCLLLPQTGLAGAHAIAERIRHAVSGRIVAADGLVLRTTVSIGVAAYPDHAATDLRELVRKADEALYRAKRAGRDRVVAFAA